MRGALAVAMLILGGWSAAAPPPPAALPSSILPVPFSPDTAARTVDVWADAGVEGFVFPYRPGEGEDGPDAGEREAVTRLREAGIARSFLFVDVEMEEGPYASAAGVEALARLMGGAAAHARATGYAGLVIESAPESLVHDYLWDGYDGPEGQDRAALAERAYRAGRDAMTAALEAYPTCEVAVLGSDPLLAGPLWFRFMEGLAAGLGRTGDGRIQLVLDTPRGGLTAGYAETLTRRARNLLGLHFSPANWRLWERRGGVSLQLRAGPDDLPRGERRDPRFDPGHANPPFLLPLTVSAAYSSHYTWIQVESWPDLLEDLAEERGESSEPTDTDAGPERFPLRLLEDLEGRLRLRTPLHGGARVGAHGFAGADGFIGLGPEGAQVMLWNGLAQSHVLENRRRAVPVWDLEVGDVAYLQPEEGRVEIEPRDGPVAITRLPAQDAAWPAMLWLDAGPAVPPGAAPNSIAYGVVNRTNFRLRGELDALAPIGGSVSPDGAPFDLAPGDSLSAPAVLRFPERRPGPVSVRLTAILEGGGTVTRSFTLDPQPAEPWRLAMAGPMAAPPITAVLEGGREVILAASLGGTAACVAPNGALLWRRHAQTRFATAPIIGQSASGGDQILLIDHRARIWALAPDGAPLWETALDVEGREAPGAISAVTARLHGYPGTELAAAVPGEGVWALLSDGSVLWRRDAGPGVVRLGAVPAEAGDGLDRLAIAHGVGGQGALTVVNGLGETEWTQGLSAAPSMAPVASFVSAGGEAAVLAGAEDGRLQAWRAADGEPAAARSLPCGEPVLGVALVPGDGVGDPETELALVAATPSAVYGLSRALTVLWTVDAAGSGAPAVLTYGAALVFAQPVHPHAMLGLSAEGEILWSDRRPAAPFPGPAAAFTLGGRPAYAYGGHGQHLRAATPPPPAGR